jgi:hypothetical protein
MPAPRIFTPEEIEKLRKLREVERLTWDTITQRFNVSRQRLIEEAEANNISTESLQRKSRPRKPGDPPPPLPSMKARPPLSAGSAKSMKILLEAPSLEDRWKDDIE